MNRPAFLRTPSLFSLCLVVVLGLVGCSPTSNQPQATAPQIEEVTSEEVSQITGDVAATVEAAIALAVEATITAREAGVLPKPQSPSVAELAQDSPTTPVHVATVAEATTVDSAQDTVAPAEVPVLFSPTPDQSIAIAQYVNANTRHFTGNPDAKVVLVEFSDFW